MKFLLADLKGDLQRNIPNNFGDILPCGLGGDDV